MLLQFLNPRDAPSPTDSVSSNDHELISSINAGQASIPISNILFPYMSSSAATAAMAEEEVTVVDFWCNEFGMRARIALHELGVPFHFISEDLRVRDRSDLVLRMNPVHRSIPILIHSGRPVCGSLNIVEYADETFFAPTRHRHRLLPDDPLERARARFWAEFVDRDVYGAQTRFFTSHHHGGGEGEKKAALAELLGHLRRLEAAALGDGRPFFGGEEFGFLDVALVPFTAMFYGYEKHGGVDMEVECPALMRWVDRCRKRESVREVLPSGEDMYAIHKEFYQIQ